MAGVLAITLSIEEVVWDSEEDSGHGKVTGSWDSLLISIRSTPRGRGLLRLHSLGLTSLSPVFFMNERIQPLAAE